MKRTRADTMNQPYTNHVLVFNNEHTSKGNQIKIRNSLTFRLTIKSATNYKEKRLIKTTI